MANDPSKAEQVHSVLTAAVALTSLGEQYTTVPSRANEDDITGNARIFPQKLHDILSDEANADSVAWLPHGRGFIIKNRKQFAAEVLPKYFKQTKYTSFTRKLNRWDFTRVTRGPELGAYYHKFFQKDKHLLCTQMYCKNERAKFAKASTLTPVTPVILPKSVSAGQSAIVNTTLPTKKVMMSAHPTPQSLSKIHPSFLLSQRAKIFLATHAVTQAARLNFPNKIHQTSSTALVSHSSNAEAIVNAAIRALNRSNALTSTTQQRQGSGTGPSIRQLQPVYSRTAFMPKSLPLQGVRRQAQMTQKRNGASHKRQTYLASAA